MSPASLARLVVSKSKLPSEDSLEALSGQQHSVQAGTVGLVDRVATHGLARGEILYLAKPWFPSKKGW